MQYKILTRDTLGSVINQKDIFIMVPLATKIPSGGHFSNLCKVNHGSNI